MRVLGASIEVGTLRQVNYRRVARNSLASLWRIYLMLVLAVLLGQRWLMYPVPRNAAMPLGPNLELLKILTASRF
jgi:hypothetical protein